MPSPSNNFGRSNRSFSDSVLADKSEFEDYVDAMLSLHNAGDDDSMDIDPLEDDSFVVSDSGISFPCKLPAYVVGGLSYRRAHGLCRSAITHAKKYGKEYSAYLSEYASPDLPKRYKKNLDVAFQRLFTGTRLCVMQSSVPAKLDIVKSITKRQFYALSVFLLQLWDCDSIMNFAVCFVDFLVKLTESTDVFHLGRRLHAYGHEFNIYDKIAKPFLKYFSFDLERQGEDLEENRFREFLTVMKNIRTNFQSIKDYPIVKKFVRVIHHLSTSAFAVSIGLTPDMGGLLPQPHHKFVKNRSTADFLISFGDFILDFVDGSFQYFVDGNEFAFVHTGSRYAEWLEKVNILISNKSLRIPESDASELSPQERANVLTTNEYWNMLHETISLGKEIQSIVLKNGNMSELNFISRYLDQLLSIEQEILLNEKMGENRDPPFTLLIAGPPDIGKSILSEMPFRLHAQLSNTTYQKKSRHVVNASMKHFDGYHNGVEYVLLDDLAFQNVKRSSEMPDDLKNVIKMVNTVNFPLPMANLQDKGKIFFNPKMIVATTNVKQLNAQHFFQCPAALLRRFPIIFDVRVKPEFEVITENGRTGQLDTRKIRAYKKLQGVNFVDCWDIYIQRVELKSGNSNDVNYVSLNEGKPFTFPMAMNFLGKEIVDHLSKNRSASATSNAISKMTYCPKCYVPLLNGIKCLCESKPLDPQGPMDVLSSTFSIFSILACFYFCIRLYEFMKKQVDAYTHIHNAVSFCKEAKAYITRLGDNMAYARCKGFEVWVDVMRLAKEYIIELLALLTLGALGAYFCSNKDNTKPQNVPSDIKYVPRKDVVNPWFSDDVSMEPLPCNNASTSVGVDMVDPLFAKHCFFMRINHGDKVRRVRVTAIGGLDFLAVNHTIPTGQIYVTLHKSVGDGIQPVYKCALNDCSVVRDVKNDLCLIRIPGFNPVKDLTKYFNDSFIPNNRPIGIFHAYRGYDGEFVKTPDTGRGAIGMSYMATVVPSESIQYSVNDVGMCGSLVISRLNRGHGILGIHVAGDPNRNIGQGKQVLISHINEMRSRFDSLVQPKIDEGVFTIKSVNPDLQPQVSTELHRKNLTRWIPEGRALVYGEMSGIPRAKHTADVRKTLIHSDIVSQFGPVNYSAPEMKIGHVAGIYRNPLQDAVTQISQADVQLDPEILDRCAKHYLSRVYSKVSLADIKKVRVLTDYEAVNGIQGEPHINCINKSAGGGIGMFAKKSNYLIPSPTPEAPHGVDWSGEVYDEIFRLREEMEAGRLVYPVFQANLKNEPVKLKPRPEEEQLMIRDYFNGMTDEQISRKMGVEFNYVSMKPKDVRVFTGTPAAWSHEVRRYFLYLTQVIQENNVAFETAVGTNAMSCDWEMYYQYLTEHGSDRMVAGDYAKYDKSIPGSMLTYVGYIFLDILRASGNFSDTQLLAAETTIYDSSMPLISFDGTLIKMMGSLPSGHPLTVQYNSVCNSLFMRYAWVSKGYDLEDFDRCVNLLTYGDDNILNIKRGYDDFNHTTISNVLRGVGITYTMADKDSESIPYIHIDDCEFLKRKWLYHEDFGVHVAPLDKKSIFKYLAYCCDTSLDPVTAAITNYDTALRDAFLHGKEFYDMLSEELYKIHIKHGVSVPTVSYEQMMSILAPSYMGDNRVTSVRL